MTAHTCVQIQRKYVRYSSTLGETWALGGGQRTRKSTNKQHTGSIYTSKSEENTGNAQTTRRERPEADSASKESKQIKQTHYYYYCTVGGGASIISTWRTRTHESRE